MFTLCEKKSKLLKAYIFPYIHKKMSSPFAYLKSATSRAHKNATKFADQYSPYITSDPDSYTNWERLYNEQFDRECKYVLNEIRRMKKMKEIIQEEFKELLLDDQPEANSYFITIRPDDTQCKFEEFYERVTSIVSRKCFLDYTLSYEQKGTDPSSLGKGFHCHIVAKMKQRSKGEVLRDIQSSLKDWIENHKIASNCIDVVLAKRPQELINKYLINYESEDEHKEATKTWDELWRTEMGLKPIYNPSIKSDGRVILNVETP